MFLIIVFYNLPQEKTNIIVKVIVKINDNSHTNNYALLMYINAITVCSNLYISLCHLTTMYLGSNRLRKLFDCCLNQHNYSLNKF